jgi:branched-subunit amino acid aminotransferase/4-amino-4-deoxychorismate lyase
MTASAAPAAAAPLSAWQLARGVPSPAQQHMFVVYRDDGKPETHHAAAVESARGMMLAYPQGPYTTARTLKTTSIFEFEAHVERMAQSAALMLEPEDGRYPSLTRASLLRPRMKSCMANCILSFQEKYPQHRGELKLTLLADWKESEGVEGDFILMCHATPLPPIPLSPVVVEVRGRPRENALVKDSAWVRERTSLEVLKLEGTNEIVLPDESGRILEGTQTNFYAIRDGAVYTAGDGILEGTVRRLLLQVCEQHGIPVIFEPVQESELLHCEGCIISSTSRLALPVDRIIVPKEGQRADLVTDTVYEFPEGGMAQRIAELVYQGVSDTSTPIMQDE